ncbi:hypothetical protein BB560_006486 [Smittium megazygosporum]|uniref:Uncharacterized protein n=1 Tax=Smittium megazygosporum TaxID=133381 RepID=A0A2T9Y559_9FUNG|nr:hypothetical protein BB560_006486 [Smittium megazygosporum]
MSGHCLNRFISIFFPPAGVLLEAGCSADFLINIGLTSLGLIHACYIIDKTEETGLQPFYPGPNGQQHRPYVTNVYIVKNDGETTPLNSTPSLQHTIQNTLQQSGHPPGQHSTNVFFVQTADGIKPLDKGQSSSGKGSEQESYDAPPPSYDQVPK